MKILKAFILSRTIFHLCKLLFFFLLLALAEKAFAQSSRIAVVNLADSNLIYKHVGFTPFKDKADTFNCRLNCRSYIEKELLRLLSTRYDVNLLSIPNSLISPNGSIYTASDTKKDVNSWISTLNKQFDYVLFIENSEQIDPMDVKKQKLQSSGILSRGNPPNGWVAVYTTTSYTLIRTSNLQNLDYAQTGMDCIVPLTEYQFSRENLLIDPEMLPFIRTKLIKLIDYKLEYFLTNSYLISVDEYEHLKSSKTE